jgi:predicted metalloprotease
VVRLTRLFISALIVCLGLQPCMQSVAHAAPFLPATSAELPTAAQADAPDATTAAANMAVELSQLEAAQDFESLYERMHPDARAVVPRSAVIGWYEATFADRSTSELTVTGVTFEPWTWGVTGVTYDDAATVNFIQPYVVDGVEQDVTGEVHLVPYGDRWGWFFGASHEFLDQQIALYGDDGTETAYALAQQNADDTADEDDVPREIRFPDPLHAHIDAFWAAQFADAGRVYHPPNGVIGFDRPIVTACGRADPKDEAAFYCVLDQTIYYSTEFRTLVEQQIGDFAWVVIVAHEWGHHIQAQLGFDLGAVPDSAAQVAPIELEQQADCLAGSYSIDAENSGWLDPGDIQEALYITEISGDPVGTAWNDPRAHGTGEARIDAFLKGYGAGISACDLDLSQAEPAA